MRYARTIIVVILSVITIILTGCFSSRPKDIEAFLKPYEVDVTAKSYALQPPDEIEIHCSKVPEIHLQRQRIRPDGNVTFENLGSIPVAGKTPEEVADILRTKVSELYTLAGDKPIDVQIATYQSKVFYVLGEVERPGPKVYTGRDSVLAAIAAANPTALAWDKRIQVIRPSSDKNTRPKVFQLNFEKMRVHGDVSMNVLLQEGDIIYVPPTILASLGKTVQEVLTPITSTFSTINVIQRTMVGPSTTQSGP